MLLMKLMVIFHHHNYLVEVYHEKMDLIEKKIHKINFHLPINLIYYNQDNILDLVDSLKSSKQKTNQIKFYLI